MRARRVAFIYTTFPVQTETFLRRELFALKDLGFEPELFSVWKGDPSWEGRPVRRMERGDWFSLLWRVPAEAVRAPRLFLRTLGKLFSHAPRSLENTLENLAGFAAAITWRSSLASAGIDHFHAAWASAPAATASYLAEALGKPYSTGAHAYDVFRDGGDWLLSSKVRFAAFVQCSTSMARSAVLAHGADPRRVLWLRRGILDFKPCPPTRTPRTPLRLLSVARLVPKKGHDFQLKVYSALHKAGVAFDATLIGDGPLRSKIEAEIRDAGLSGKVRLLGARGEAEVAEAFSQADVLLHTGVVASNGDRDGLPNVIGEAMSHGVVVLATPVAGVGEAIENGWNGLLGTPGAVDCWVRLLQELARDDALYNRLRLAAFAWVQAHFDARRNARRLLERIDATLAIADGPRMDSPKDSPPSRKRRRRRKPQARAVADASDSQQKPNSGSREGESLGAP